MVDFVVCGKLEDIKVSLMCGEREENYSLNGNSSNLIPYGILTVDVSNEAIDVKEVKYVLFVGVNKFEGIMEKNPYEDSWVVDIKEIVDKEDNIAVDIYIKEVKYSTKLTSIDADWIINSRDIINDILLVDYKEQIKYFIKDNDFLGEIYIKLINDYDKYSSRYYYYVSIQGVDNSSMNLLISPKTAEVLANNLIGFDS